MEKISFAGARVRLKAKIMINCQDMLLKTLGKAMPGSRLQTIIRGFSRRYIGGYPYVIKLDITDACNLKCKMCYAKNKGREIPLDNLLSILKQIGDVPLRLDLLGGEPLLRKDICDFIRYAKRQTAIKEVVLYTNGTLVSEELAAELSRAGLNKAIVTLISHDSIKHDYFTSVKNSWEQTVSGIKNFLRAGIKVYTFTALHSENISDFEHINRYVRDQLKITPLFYQYVPQNQDDPLMPPLEKWYEVKHKVLCDYRPQHFQYIKEIVTFCGRVCLGGYYAISIKADGSVTPCPFMYDISIGNVFKENIWDIFAKRYNCSEFREFMELPDDCVKCSYKDFCGGGCKAGNKVLFGSYLRKDCRCSQGHRQSVVASEMPDKIPTFF